MYTLVYGSVVQYYSAVHRSLDCHTPYYHSNATGARLCCMIAWKSEWSELHDACVDSTLTGQSVRAILQQSLARVLQQSLARVLQQILMASPSSS